jgi:hypothetical protein
MGDPDVMMCTGDLLLGSFSGNDQGVEPLFEGISVGSWKGDNV